MIWGEVKITGLAFIERRTRTHYSNVTQTYDEKHKECTE